MSTATRLIRAAITDAEWASVRKAAIDSKVATSELVAAALRAHVLERPASRPRRGLK